MSKNALAAKPSDTVYEAVRQSLVSGDTKTALRILDSAANSGSGPSRQAYRQRQQLIAQDAQPTDERQRLFLFDAMNARERGDLKLAIRNCNTVIESGTTSIFSDDAQNLVAYISLVDRLDFTEARRHYRKLRASYPESNYYDAALFGEALAEEKLGNFNRAQRLHKTLLDKHTGISVGFLDIAYPKDNLLSRLWFNRAEAKLKYLENRRDPTAIKSSSPGLIMGARLSYDLPVSSGTNFRSTAEWLDRYDVPATHIAHWLTENTVWEWESAEKVAAASRAGYTPVLIDWYFGDKISPSLVARSRDQYLERLQTRIIPLLAKAPNAMIILEPEFNKNGIDDWQPWGNLMLEAIRMIHQQTSARVGLAIGDWADFDNPTSLQSVDQAVSESDFVAFLIMTSREHEGAFQSPTNDLGSRFNRAMTRLEERYDQPIVLAYTAISSADGWEPQQAHFLKELLALTGHYSGDRLEAVGYFSLFDNPDQSGWFGKSETSFGVLDHIGTPKLSLTDWREGAKKLWALDTSPPLLGASALEINSDGSLSFQANFSEWVRWSLSIDNSTAAPAQQQQGSGRTALVQLPNPTGLVSPTNPVTATLLARDATGNVVQKTFEARRKTGKSMRVLQALDPKDWAVTDGVTRDLINRSSANVTFTRPFGQLRMPINGLPANSSILMTVASEVSLNGLYLSAEDRSGTRHRVLLDHLLPSANTTTGNQIQIRVADIVSSNQHLTPSGALSHAPADGNWETLILENSATTTALTLSSLAIANQEQSAERPLVRNRWGN